MLAAKVMIGIKAILAPIFAIFIIFGTTSIVPDSWIMDVWQLKYDRASERVLFGRTIPFTLTGISYTQIIDGERTPVCGWQSDESGFTGRAEFIYTPRHDDFTYPNAIPLRIWAQDLSCDLEQGEIYQLRGKWVINLFFTKFTVTKESDWFVINDK